MSVVPVCQSSSRSLVIRIASVTHTAQPAGQYLICKHFMTLFTKECWGHDNINMHKIRKRQYEKKCSLSPKSLFKTIGL